MYMKTKDRCEKLAREAGMSMKTRELSLESENVVENKGTNGWGLGAG